ncbi:MAG: cysteine--tRNA ligase, partial [Candidatus Omnitrophica bacterium]|nr:cysteine--tRNA ligase [Candidatus Omnitrophota bacterium]
MPIYIYNSLTRKKEEFTPINADSVKMYVCGPTVYDEPHIGHARGAFVFEVIRNYFKYKKYSVKYVRNVTDVDDKIIDKAKKEFPGEDLSSAVGKVSSKYLVSYHQAMEHLGILGPDVEPKATAYINKMIGFIEHLIENDAAYVADGDVYFDIKKAKDYGKLSNQSLEKMESGARVMAGENKKDPLDFALWKKPKEGEQFWPSPWGNGRPGWHIECSAMSSDILGDEFDIHGGGIDLIFPHHENEIAQSEGAGKKFARYWMHNGLLTINSQKMAKSLGNFITISVFLEKYKDPDILKIFFLSSHYHMPVDFTDEAIEAAKAAVERFNIFFGTVEDFVSRNKAGSPKGADKEFLKAIHAEFEKAMDDDFNTARALAVLFEAVTAGNSMINSDKFSPEKKAAFLNELVSQVKEMAKVLGLNFMKKDISGNMKKMIAEKMEARETARRKKDY